MNTDLKDAFTRTKAVCDAIMVCPTEDSIAEYTTHVVDFKKEVVQELQQYLLFPLITHLKSSKTENKHDLQLKLVDAMRMVLEKVTVNSFEMCMKMEIGLLQIVFDHTKPGMIAEIPEELKYSVMQCLTVLLLNVDSKYREVMFKTHVPLLGKAVYVSVHIAKLEKLRVLRLAAIHCVTAHTATHDQLTTDYHISDPVQEKLVIDMLSLILPGVLGALQDVATCHNNPGHALVVTAIDAMHRILCLAMSNKFMTECNHFTVEDFLKLVKEKENKEVSSKAVDPKSLPVRSPEWFSVAGEKLLLITRSLVSLTTHEHFKVRKELAVYCARLLLECDIAMKTSVPLALNTLITLTKDEYPLVSMYCVHVIRLYFENCPLDKRRKTLDLLCDNLFVAINGLPRVMNNIDSNRKLAALKLVHGYLDVLVTEQRPQRLTAAMSCPQRVHSACVGLLQCAAARADLTLLTQHAVRDFMKPPPKNSPWYKLRHLENPMCEWRLHEVLRHLGLAEGAALMLDHLIELFQQEQHPEIIYICNWMASATSSEDVVKRILREYIEENVWYLPLEVGNDEPPLTEEDTLDVTVYNPRAWYKDSVPGLYEGTVETRYTDISSRSARTHVPRGACRSVREAQRNMLLCCLLTEGVGAVAKRMGLLYEPFLLKTLCLVLERVGSKYEMLHLAGLKALHDITAACEHFTVAELIKTNADYIINEVSNRLKKAWDCQSALQILSVVMEYSDYTILNYLYGIVQDVLVQSCDKYYEKDLYGYLQVFLTFVDCIRKWYTIEPEAPKTCQENKPIDVMQELRVFVESKEEVETLLNSEEFEKETGKSVEEMYKEDVKRKEEDILDYDDNVTEKNMNPPQHVDITVAILKRCLNYVSSSQRDNSILALKVLNRGLPILRHYDKELLPLVHLTWAPLVNRFDAEPPVMKAAFELLVTMAELARDFIRSRAVKDVLPHIYKFLLKSSKDSYLKDVGSSYRNSLAYELQQSALAALPHLATSLALEGEPLEQAMNCVQPYLSKKQPKVLQGSAVEFFKTILAYNYGAAWYHLRTLCDNEVVLSPPADSCLHLLPVVGTPYHPTDKDYENNITLIFNHAVS